MTIQLIARANGIDTVHSYTGLGGLNCNGPMETVTGPSSMASKLFLGGVPVVLIGDYVGTHPAIGCGPDLSVLTTGSSKLFVGGKAVARVGDLYTSDNVITSGYSKFFIP